MSHPEPIQSQEELENILLMGMSLWAVEVYREGLSYPWELVDASLLKEARGTALASSSSGNPKYLARCGIKDSDNHHTVHTYDVATLRLFTSKKDALTWKNCKNRLRP